MDPAIGRLFWSTTWPIWVPGWTRPATSWSNQQTRAG